MATGDASFGNSVLVVDGRISAIGTRFERGRCKPLSDGRRTVRHNRAYRIHVTSETMHTRPLNAAWGWQMKSPPPITSEVFAAERRLATRPPAFDEALQNKAV